MPSPHTIARCCCRSPMPSAKDSPSPNQKGLSSPLRCFVTHKRIIPSFPNSRILLPSNSFVLPPVFSDRCPMPSSSPQSCPFPFDHNNNPINSPSSLLVSAFYQPPAPTRFCVHLPLLPPSRFPVLFIDSPLFSSLSTNPASQKQKKKQANQRK